MDAKEIAWRAWKAGIQFKKASTNYQQFELWWGTKGFIIKEPKPIDALPGIKCTCLQVIQETLNKGEQFPSGCVLVAELGKDLAWHNNKCSIVIEYERVEKGRQSNE